MDRRTIQVDIEVVHKAYKTYAVKEDLHGFGGVFHQSLKEEINDRYDELNRERKEQVKLREANEIDKDYAIIYEEFVDKVEDLRLEMYNRTVQLLEPYRWMKWENLSSFESQEKREAMYDEEEQRRRRDDTKDGEQ